MTNAAAEMTTARLDKETWARLNAMRSVPSESINGVIRRLLAERESATAPPK